MQTNMCTPWTMTRLVRWRLRDWASCFLPLDDEPASSPRAAARNMAFDKRNDNRVYHNKLSRPRKKCRNKTQMSQRMEKHKDEASVGNINRVDDSTWSLSADEDYIVFCFGEDGAFDVMKDGKSDGNPRNSRPVNRKLSYGGDAEQVCKQRIEKQRSNANQYPNPCNEEEKEKESRNKGGCQIEEVEDRGMVSSESRDSNQSEGSTGSFAFPVLGWEWIGSPVQLPKSEGLHLSKQKVRSLRFQCCRF